MRLSPAILAALIVSGCATSSPVSELPLAQYQTVAPAPVAESLALASETYRIEPLDELRIDVFGEPELSLTELPVDPDGGIVVPLAGRVPAAGLTTAELSDSIAKRLVRYLREPQVAVNVTTFTSQTVTVEGAVRMPGMYPLRSRMTLMDAIALGQGTGDYAKKDEVVVVREQGGQKYIARFDLNAIQAGLATDPQIVRGDVVVVGFSEARRRFGDVLAVLPAAVGIFLAIIPNL